MTAVFIGPTDLIIDGLFPPRYDAHVMAWRWDRRMPIGYLDDVAKRQADKRAAGIGPEGRCGR